MADKRGYVVVIFHANGVIDKTVQPKKPDYDQMSKAVGGMIETIPAFTRFAGLSRGIAYANEEGLLKGLPYNRNATKAWFDDLTAQGRPFSKDRVHLVGDVIFIAKEPTGASNANA